jgi:hypothetical protein
MVRISDPWAETPRPTEAWRALSDDERLSRVRASWTRPPVEFLRAQANGHVTCRVPETMKAAERGPLLLRVEAFLRANVEPSLLVYLEAVQDRNALRRLRGVRVVE